MARTPPNRPGGVPKLAVPRRAVLSSNGNPLPPVATPDQRREAQARAQMMTTKVSLINTLVWAGRGAAQDLQLAAGMSKREAWSFVIGHMDEVRKVFDRETQQDDEPDVPQG